MRHSGKNHLQVTVNLQATRAILAIVAISMILIWMIISTALAALSYAHGFVLYIVVLWFPEDFNLDWTSGKLVGLFTLKFVAHFTLWLIWVLVFGRSLY
jgi:hypothetical protein